MHSYHLTTILPNGQRRVDVEMCRDSAAAVSLVTDRYPGAARVDVRRLTTVLRCGRRAPGFPVVGRAPA